MKQLKIKPDAIVLACWPCNDPALSQLGIDPLQIVFADKSMLQRVLEKLIRAGKNDIVVVLGDSPQRYREMLGNGERWGCHIHYCYASDGAHPLSVLSRYDYHAQAPCLIATADTIITGDVPENQTCSFCWNDSGFIAWTGWANLNAAQIQRMIVAAQDRDSLEAVILDDIELTRYREKAPISTTDVRMIINSIPKLFSLSPGCDGIMRQAQAPQIWVGNGSTVHPDAMLNAPVYIGNNVSIGAGAYIGPNTVIANGCVIAENSIITASFILPDTYLGATLEISGSVVSCMGVAHIEHHTIAKVDDANLLGDMNANTVRTPQFPFWQKLLARALWLILLPLALALKNRFCRGEYNLSAEIGVPDKKIIAYTAIPVSFHLSHELIYSGTQFAWLAHFIFTFHPGLIEVIRGKINIIGLQPRTVQEINSLAVHWRELYQNTASGLLNETLLLGRDGAPEEMRYAGDVLATKATVSLYTFQVLLRYIRNVFTNLAETKLHYWYKKVS